MANRVGVNTTRTAMQLVPAAVVTEFIDAFFYDFNDKQYGAAISMGLLLTVLIQNLWEYKSGRVLVGTPTASDAELMQP